MNELKPELKAQIEKEAIAKFSFGGLIRTVSKRDGYVLGAGAYALKLQQAEELLERMAIKLYGASLEIEHLNSKEVAFLTEVKALLTEYNNYKQTNNGTE